MASSLRPTQHRRTCWTAVAAIAASVGFPALPSAQAGEPETASQAVQVAIEGCLANFPLPDLEAPTSDFLQAGLIRVQRSVPGSVSYGGHEDTFVKVTRNRDIHTCSVVAPAVPLGQLEPLLDDAMASFLGGDAAARLKRHYGTGYEWRWDEERTTTRVRLRRSGDGGAIYIIVDGVGP